MYMLLTRQSSDNVFTRKVTLVAHTQQRKGSVWSMSRIMALFVAN